MNLRRHEMTQKWGWLKKSQKICKIFPRKKSLKTLDEIIESQLPREPPLPHKHHPFLVPKLQVRTCRKKLKLPLSKLTREVSQ